MEGGATAGGGGGTADDGRQRRRAVAYLGVACASWGASFVLARVVTQVMGVTVPEAGRWFTAAQPVAWRFGLGLLVLVLLFRGGVRPRRREVAHGAALGIILAAALLLQMLGLQVEEAGAAAFLTQTGVVLVPLFGAVERGRWPGLRQGLAIALVLFGGAVLMELDWRDLRPGWGEACILGSAAIFALQVYWLERDAFRGVRSVPCTAVMFAVAGAVFAVLGAATAPAAGAWVRPLADPAGGLAVLALVAFPTVLAFVLMNRWQPCLGATEAGIIYGAESVFAALFAAFLPGLFALQGGAATGLVNEELSRPVALGGALIVLANVLVHMPAPRRRPRGRAGPGPGAADGAPAIGTCAPGAAPSIPRASRKQADGNHPHHSQA